MAPVDQVFPLVAEDVNTTFPPWQKVVGPFAAIVGAVGFGLTITVVPIDVAEQPTFPEVTV